MVTVRCPIWIVLLHRTVIYKQEPVSLKSALVNIRLGSKTCIESGNRWAFLNNPKKDTRQIAQNEACLLHAKFKRERMRYKRGIVIGSLGLGGTPSVRLMPRITEVTTQLSDNGL